ncbi:MULTISPECIES: ComEA family DNA-binding protein [Methylobacillus]|uniref:Competence protein ComEA helix-hairpin-helix region n=1 Tax=Methylobacillus flagellatus (strain ATCC 51484 / DSM 6875 / VKM B-1610 / KT) TaxID=265072 RepID=Q1H2F3_METFK|nr:MULTISPECIES: helix-hairpin-helix domain-containing protein [Methylobacillus]ABE49190.1 Competence protein ComEA helix-hairpin-helix region [Methylobacillus flagellatus KT]ABE49334.1 Competence protein ComEA helix-hairpin-helix region [Methylobacillus flagellatus KT]MPS48098.1 helix-hairpin-helix domain-containing protein [Methylobacillus sp.]
MKSLLFAVLVLFGLTFNAMAAVDLNTASAVELESVKGIGPAKAQAIIDYRKANGSFKSVDDLDNVKGFGKKSIDKLRSEVSVGKTPKAEKTTTAKNDKK